METRPLFPWSLVPIAEISERGAAATNDGLWEGRSLCPGCIFDDKVESEKSMSKSHWPEMLAKIYTQREVRSVQSAQQCSWRRRMERPEQQLSSKPQTGGKLREGFRLLCSTMDGTFAGVRLSRDSGLIRCPC